MTRTPLPKAGVPRPLTLDKAFAPVVRAATGLPEVEAGPAYGTPALRVHGKFLARIKEDGETLVLRTDFDSREVMLPAQPSIFQRRRS